MPRRRKKPIDQDPHVNDQDPPVNDQDPIDQDPVDPPEPEPEPDLDDGRGDMVRVVVLATTNMVFESQKTYRNPMGKIPFRGKVSIPRDEFEAINELDRAAGRELRLLEI